MSADGDSRVLGCVLEGIHNEICEHLHDEVDVDAHQQDIIIVALNGDGVAARCACDMAEGSRDNLVDEFGCEVEVYTAVLDPGDGEQVFNGIDQPKGVVVDGVGEVSSLFGGELLVAFPKDRCGSGDRREGRSQVMAYGAKEVGAQLLVSG